MSGAIHPAFERRQRARSLAFVGPTFTPDWSETVTIIGRHPPLNGDADWYVIRFEDGGMLSSHASRLMASNEPPFKGRLPSYASTQR